MEQPEWPEDGVLYGPFVIFLDVGLGLCHVDVDLAQHEIQEFAGQPAVIGVVEAGRARDQPPFHALIHSSQYRRVPPRIRIDVRPRPSPKSTKHNLCSTDLLLQ